MFEVRLVTLNLRCYPMVVFSIISPDFAKCSMALHELFLSVVVKNLSTFTSLALSTLAPMFRRAEPSLFAQGHVKMISFFSRSWHSSAFHLFKSNFLGTYWSASSGFRVNIAADLGSIKFQTFGRRDFCYRCVIGDVRFSNFGFFGGQTVYF